MIKVLAIYTILPLNSNITILFWEEIINACAEVHIHNVIDACDCVQSMIFCLVLWGCHLCLPC